MTRYIRIEHVVVGTALDRSRLDELLDLDLIDYRRPEREVVEVAESDCEELRAMLRLRDELEINAAGVAAIVHMRRRVRELQEELRRLRGIERMYVGAR